MGHLKKKVAHLLAMIKPKSTAATASLGRTGKAYTPYPFSVHRTHIDISINPLPGRHVTHVTSTLLISAAAAAAQPQQQHTRSSSGDTVTTNMPHELVLDGDEDLELLDIQLAGAVLPASSYTIDRQHGTLTIHTPPAGAFELVIRTAIYPEENRDMHGLFVRNGIYTTQCEATGFSLLTFYPNRPDVRSMWSVRLEAEEAALPVLLSNGNLKDNGKLPGARHFTLWEDPWPKPCYLFSMVAGHLAVKEGSHTIRSSGRQVAVRIYTAPPFSHQLEFALLWTQAAIAWDEAVWGREYDLDVYSTVGVEGFEDDGTETKGMTILDMPYLAVSPETHTDAEADEAVRLIAHEYFHNWSGGRVTVRDWYELTVKEGLTRFRDYAFAADMDAAAAAAAAAATLPAEPACTTSSNNVSSNTAVLMCKDQEQALLQRIRAMALTAPAEAILTAKPTAETKITPPTAAAAAVPATAAAYIPAGCVFGSSWRRVLEAQQLRQDQFPEDEGGDSHPVRPCRGTSLDDIYTDTVYNKGAEIVRMYYTILGREEFYSGLQSFFCEYDHQAATCDDFCSTMFAGSSCSNLAVAMMRWYDTNGLPELKVKAVYSPAKQSLTVTVKQELETAERPLLIPVKIGLIGAGGTDLPLHLKPDPRATVTSATSSTHTNSSRNSYIHTELIQPGLCGTESRSMVLLLDTWSNSWTFTRLTGKPLVSVLRDFSAPVRVEVEGETDKSLGLLATYDSNPYARWDAMQRLMTRALLRLYHVAQGAAKDGHTAVQSALAAAAGTPPALVTALIAALQNDNLDGQYKALLLKLPSIGELEHLLEEPNPLLLHKVRAYVAGRLAQQLQPQLQQLVTRCDEQLTAFHAAPAAAAFAGFHPTGVKLRAARNAALGLLSHAGGRQLEQQLLERYYDSSGMTDRMVSLRLLVDRDTASRAAALQHFYDTYQAQPLVLLKWFEVQAASDMPGNVQHVRQLMQHPAFDISNAAAVDALLDSFSASAVNFHAEDGSGYSFMADAVVEVDKVNPDAAAELAGNLADWEDVDAAHGKLMQRQLKRLAALQDALSDEVAEVVDGALDDA